MAVEKKLPEGEFFISSQGHWRYGNKKCDEEWLIPTSKIKLASGITLAFGKAIASNGKYTDIKDPTKDICFGITLEDPAYRKNAIGDKDSNASDSDGYSTHIIQSGLLRFGKNDYLSCFEKRAYSAGDKIYLNVDGVFTNNYEELVVLPYRLVEIGEVTNVYKSSNAATISDDFYIDVSINIINHDKQEADTSRFVGEFTDVNNLSLSTSMWGNRNICVMAWENGKLVPADIENKLNVAGLYIGDSENLGSISNKQISLIRNGKIYLSELPSMKIFDSENNTKSWGLGEQPLGTIYYLEKDGSVSTSPYYNNDSAGYSCPIMTYTGKRATPEGVDYYEFYVDISQPEVRQTENLHLFKDYEATIVNTQSTIEGFSSPYISELDISELLNYGTYDNINDILRDLNIKLYVKSESSDFNGYIFKGNWIEIKPGFFHFDTIRSYGYQWKFREDTSTHHYYLVMDVQDGFGLSVESGKNTGPIICDPSRFSCKVKVERFNESPLNLNLAIEEKTEYVSDGTQYKREYKNADGESINVIYDLAENKISFYDETGSKTTLDSANITSSKASMKRLYDEDKFSEFENTITGNTADKATDSTSNVDNKFTELGSAMQAIYETPMALWNYKTDPTTDKEKIGMIVDRLNERVSDSSTFGNRNLYRFDSAKTYAYSDNEITHIKNFIKLLTDTNESGIDNTNAVGILFKALKETQQRLLDLEAATYGLTSSKISDNTTQTNSSQIDNSTSNVSSNSVDFGLNRLVRALSFEIFGNANPSFTGNDLEADKSSISLFDTLEKRIFGITPTQENGTYLDNEKSDVRANSTDLSSLNSSYYSYNDDIAASVDTTFETANMSVLPAGDARKLQFNGVEDAVKRIVNKVDILSKMIFLNSNANVNVAPNTDSLLTFTHSSMKW